MSGPADMQTEEKFSGQKKVLQSGSDRIKDQNIVDDIFRKDPDRQLPVQMIPEPFGKTRTPPSQK